MQEKIQQIQDVYVALRQRQAGLENSLTEWKNATEELKQLAEFYFNPEWITLHDNADQFHLDTKGHYSVLSEDAIWNLFVEQREMAEELSQILASILTEQN